MMSFYLQTDTAWQAIREQCETAQDCIDWMQYLIADDEQGRAFLLLLMDKSRQGVQVRLVLDAFGSRSLLRSPLIGELKEAGVHIRFENRIRGLQWLNPQRWFPRNHAKLFLFDARHAFIGGTCIADYMRGWRETQYALSDEGLVNNMQQHFDEYWQYLSQGRLTRPYCPLLQRNARELKAQHPRQHQHEILGWLLDAIRSAEQHIRICSPYFHPPPCLRRALKQAIERGVRVSLLHSQRTNHPLSDWYTRALLRDWLECRIEVYYYQPTVTHAKYAVIDERLATVGSCNFDTLSLCCNHEANIMFNETSEVAELAAHFERDLADSRLARVEDWSRMPLYQQGAGLLFHWLYRLQHHEIAV